MSKEKSIIEQAPAIEITVGEIEKIPTEIAFISNEGLDYKEHLGKICSLLEKHSYDSSKLELECKDRDNQLCRYDMEGKVILDCSLKYDNLDEETIREIKEFLKTIPYVKIK